MVQMASGADFEANLAQAQRLIARAAAQGAGLVVLPENFAVMGLSEQDKFARRETEGSGPIQDLLSAQAAKHRIWIVGGTLPMASNESTRTYASCLLFDASGARVARYDKVHLFDVTLEPSGEEYMESRSTVPGDRVVVVDTPFGRLGLAVCYDLRFPEMFRAMLDRGVELIAVPSAFTAFTGKAHWEILVRARALENQCFVLAAAQSGEHGNGRRTYGDSMIVDPWGVVMDRLPQGPGVVTVECDRAHQERIRSSFPAVRHRRRSLISGGGNAGADAGDQPGSQVQV